MDRLPRDCIFFIFDLLLNSNRNAYLAFGLIGKRLNATLQEHRYYLSQYASKRTHYLMSFKPGSDALRAADIVYSLKIKYKLAKNTTFTETEIAASDPRVKKSVIASTFWRNDSLIEYDELQPFARVPGLPTSESIFKAIEDFFLRILGHPLFLLTSMPKTKISIEGWFASPQKQHDGYPRLASESFDGGYPMGFWCGSRDILPDDELTFSLYAQPVYFKPNETAKCLSKLLPIDFTPFAIDIFFHREICWQQLHSLFCSDLLDEKLQVSQYVAEESIDIDDWEEDRRQRTAEEVDYNNDSPPF